MAEMTSRGADVGQRADDRARGILGEQFPGAEIVGISALTVAEEGGAIHCVTQQQRQGSTD